MVFGTLRMEYEAPCQFYVNGPVGRIRYYEAPPGAKNYTEWTRFAPMAYRLDKENVDGTGERTTAATDAEKRRSRPGRKQGYHGRNFRVRHAPPGVTGNESHGSIQDFMGETLYTGPTPFDALPECVRRRIPLVADGLGLNATLPTRVILDGLGLNATLLDTPLVAGLGLNATLTMAPLAGPDGLGLNATLTMAPLAGPDGLGLNATLTMAPLAGPDGLGLNATLTMAPLAVLDGLGLNATLTMAPLAVLDGLGLNATLTMAPLAVLDGLGLNATLTMAPLALPDGMGLNATLVSSGADGWELDAMNNDWPGPMRDPPWNSFLWEVDSETIVISQLDGTGGDFSALLATLAPGWALLLRDISTFPSRTFSIVSVTDNGDGTWTLALSLVSSAGSSWSGDYQFLFTPP